MSPLVILNLKVCNERGRGSWARKEYEGRISFFEVIDDDKGLGCSLFSIG